MSAQPGLEKVEIARSMEYSQRGRPVRVPDITPPGKGIILRHGASVTNSVVRSVDIEAITEHCCTENPLISTDHEVLGGIPHLKGTRLSVGQVLDRIYMLETIQGVVDYYQGMISSDQVKEALAYAQDFIETACEPLEDHG